MSSGRITLDEVLDACERAGMVREPVTASEVAEEIGCSRRAALNKLDELAERGDVESKKVGARSRAWWRPPDFDSLPDRRSARDYDESHDDSGTTPVKVEGTLSDINKRLDAELEEVFGRISDAFYALDDEWRFTHVSERAEELIDYRDEGLVGKNFWEVFEWASDSKLGEEFRTAMKTQKTTSFEFYYPEPLEAWHVVHAYPSETGLSVYFQDVTDRKQRERQLEESEHRYRTLVEHFPNGAVALVDEDLRYRTVGGSPLDSTVEELEGSPLREALPPKLADELVPRYEAAFEGEFSEFEARYEGATYTFQIVPVRDDDGDIFAALGMSQNVTERKDSQRELEESERRYRTLAENFPNGAVGVYDHDLRYTLVAGEKIGDPLPSAEEIEGTRMPEQYPDDVAADLEPMFRAAIEDGETGSAQTTVAGRNWLAWATPLRNADGEIFAGLSFTQDVTEQVERERQLERALDLLDRTQRIADVGGWEIDVETQDVFWTDQTFELLEVPGDEEPPLDEALDMYHEEDKPIVVDAVESALDSGEPFDVEVRLRTAASDEVRWLRLQGVPETDDGEVVSFRGAAQDVTEKVERERELEERNERLDSFASMLAHELRNPVTIGQIYSQQLPDDADAEAASYVTEAFDRIEDMIDVLLVLTRGREAIGERTPVQLADAARKAWEKVETPDATVEVAVDQTIQADETYVQHLFRNLFENAVEHGSTSNRPSADDAVEHGSTSPRSQAHEDAVEHGDAAVSITVGDLPSGFYVADDGPGIPADERDAVFEAGYTTAAEQGGTGLGLAFVQKLADVYGWEYAVTESSTGGARFEFTNVDADSRHE